MRIKANKTGIAMLGGALGIVLVAVGGVFWLQRTAYGKVAETLSSRRQEVEAGEQIAQRKEQSRTALERDREELSFLEDGVSDAAYVPTLLKQLESLAQTTSNQVRSVRPQPVEVQAPTKLQQRRDPDASEKPQGSGDKDGKAEEKKRPEPYIRLSILVSLVGNYQSVQEFTNRLQRFPKIIAVEELQIRPHREVALNTDKLDVEMKLTAFVMKDAAPGRPSVTASAGSGANTP